MAAIKAERSIAMDAQEIWQRFQKHMGYTDAELEIFKKDTAKVKRVTGTPDFVKCRIIAEVIESHGCHAGHRVGDRFVMNAGGQLLSEQCPKKMCMAALGPVSNVIPVIFDRFDSHSDPNYERFKIVQCTDIGLDKGGWGKILMKVFVQKPE